MYLSSIAEKTKSFHLSCYTGLRFILLTDFFAEGYIEKKGDPFQKRKVGPCSKARTQNCAKNWGKSFTKKKALSCMPKGSSVWCKVMYRSYKKGFPFQKWFQVQPLQIARSLQTIQRTIKTPFWEKTDTFREKVSISHSEGFFSLSLWGKVLCRSLQQTGILWEILK